MKPSALVFLRDDLAAQRMVVAWPLVTRRDAAEGDLLDEWAALAGVPRHVAPKVARVLRAHELVRDDGTIDTLAEQFIASQATSAIRGLRR